MVDATWLRWQQWRDAQARADEDESDCIPCMECACPPRESEDS